VGPWWLGAADRRRLHVHPVDDRLHANRSIHGAVPAVALRDHESVRHVGRSRKRIHIDAVRGGADAVRFRLVAPADSVMGGDHADCLGRRLRIRVVPEPRDRFSLQGPSRADPVVAWALSDIYAPSEAPEKPGAEARTPALEPETAARP